MIAQSIDTLETTLMTTNSGFLEALVIGSGIASILSLILYLVTHFRNKPYSSYIKDHISELRTDGSIEEKKQTEKQLSKRITEFRNQIKDTIPKYAKRVALEERLFDAIENLNAMYKTVIELKSRLIKYRDDKPEFFQNPIFIKVKREIEPRYLVRERVRKYNIFLTILLAMSSLSGLILTEFIGFIGTVITTSFLMLALVLGIYILWLIIRSSGSIPSSNLEIKHESPYSSSTDRFIEELYDAISNTINALIDKESVNSCIAMSNAYNWIVDDFELGEPELSELDGVRVPLSFYASGDQDPDKMYSGDKIDGEAIAIVRGFEEVEYEDVNAELRYYDEDQY